MKYAAFNAIALALLSVAKGQFLHCDWVHSRDCTTYSSDTVECGTDGITYDNRCYFSKAQCIDKYLHILHHGVCQSSESSTTPATGSGTTLAPGGGTDGETAILDFFCTQISHVDCDADGNSVCGTDNNTYVNYCEYDKARCTHRDLHVLEFGPCTANDNTTQSGNI